MTLVAELQDFLRFDNARKLMAYVGLVPGERPGTSRPRRSSRATVWARPLTVQVTASTTH